MLLRTWRHRKNSRFYPFFNESSNTTNMAVNGSISGEQIQILLPITGNLKKSILSKWLEKKTSILRNRKKNKISFYCCNSVFLKKFPPNAKIINTLIIFILLRLVHHSSLSPPTWHQNCSFFHIPSILSLFIFSIIEWVLERHILWSLLILHINLMIGHYRILIRKHKVFQCFIRKDYNF